jgi:hypothetical protein
MKDQDQILLENIVTELYQNKKSGKMFVELSELVEKVIVEFIGGYTAAWMAPRGDVIEVNSHADFGAEKLKELSREKITRKKGLTKLDPTEHDDIIKIYDEMYNNGWVRITIEPHPRGVTFEYAPTDHKNPRGLPSQRQFRKLKDTAVQKRVPLINGLTDEQIYSPHLEN